MAVVKAFRYDLEGLHTIELWGFLDVVDENSVPVILKSVTSGNQCCHHLRPRTFYLDDIESMIPK